MNSTRSISTNSDHYAIVHSRPGSRYSAPGSHKAATLSHPHHHHNRGPPSNIGSHYSGKLWSTATEYKDVLYGECSDVCYNEIYRVLTCG